MKRSEMVNIMWEFIQYVERDYDYYMTRYDTEQLLIKMEQAGMLPPDRTHCHCEDCGGPDHSWREEDE